jgi:hypothetical protein
MNFLYLPELETTILLLAKQYPGHHTDDAKGGRTLGLSEIL